MITKLYCTIIFDDFSSIEGVRLMDTLGHIRFTQKGEANQSKEVFTHIVVNLTLT